MSRRSPPDRATTFDDISQRGQYAHNVLDEHLPIELQKCFVAAQQSACSTGQNDAADLRVLARENLRGFGPRLSDRSANATFRLSL